MESIQLLSKVKNIPLFSVKLLDGLLSGNYRTVFRGPGLEFDEVRSYSEGDDARFIDWNVTSRLDSPYIKTFREEREIIMFLFLDVSASMRHGAVGINRSSVSAMCATLLAQSAVQNNDRVGAVLFSEDIEVWVPPMKGKKHINRLVQDMLTINPKKSGSSLGLAVRAVYESLKRRSICVIISDFKTQSGWQELTMLAKKHDVVALRIEDPADKRFPAKGLCYLQDPETKTCIPFFGFSNQAQEQFHAFSRSHNNIWIRECARCNIDNAVIYTDQNPAEALLKFFTRRRSRG